MGVLETMCPLLQAEKRHFFDHHMAFKWCGLQELDFQVCSASIGRSTANSCGPKTRYPAEQSKPLSGLLQSLIASGKCLIPPPERFGLQIIWKYFPIKPYIVVIISRILLKTEAILPSESSAFLYAASVFLVSFIYNDLLPKWVGKIPKNTEPDWMELRNGCWWWQVGTKSYNWSSRIKHMAGWSEN